MVKNGYRELHYYNMRTLECVSYIGCFTIQQHVPRTN